MIMHAKFRKDDEETHNDKCSTFCGDICIKLEKATLVRLNAVKLTVGMGEKAFLKEMEGSEDIVLERRLGIVRNKKRINTREMNNRMTSKEASTDSHLSTDEDNNDTSSNGRGVANGYAFDSVIDRLARTPN